MGKRYHCDYCDKSMVSTPLLVKTHNKGILHQKLLQEHYRQYKDPETILAEEKNKKPCVRFAKGECQFGSLCWYSHYTAEQINTFKEYVAAKTHKPDKQPSFEDLYKKYETEKKGKSRSRDDGSTVTYDSDGVTHVFPWSYNDLLDSYGDNLPPSIKRIKIEDFVNARITEWG